MLWQFNLMNQWNWGIYFGRPQKKSCRVLDAYGLMQQFSVSLCHCVTLQYMTVYLKNIWVWVNTYRYHILVG